MLGRSFYVASRASFCSRSSSSCSGSCSGCRPSTCPYQTFSFKTTPWEAHAWRFHLHIQNLEETIQDLFRRRADGCHSLLSATRLLVQLPGFRPSCQDWSRGDKHYASLFSYSGVVYMHLYPGQPLLGIVPHPCTPYMVYIWCRWVGAKQCPKGLVPTCGQYH